MKTFLFSLALAPVAFAQLQGQWPRPDTVPEVNSTWTQAIQAITASPAQIITKCPNIGEWSLTFDDGPTSEATVRLLDILDRANIKVTLFVVGSRAYQNPTVLKRAYNAGHVIALHSWSHADLATLTEDQLVADLVWNFKAVYDAIGVLPKYFRVPFGSTNERVLATLGKFGLTLVGWNRDTNDFRLKSQPGEFTASMITDNVSQWVTSNEGSIILQHDLHPETIEPVPDVLRIIQASSIKLRTLSECLGNTNPYGMSDQLTELITGMPPQNPGGANKNSTTEDERQNSVTSISITFALLTTMTAILVHLF